MPYIGNPIYQSAFVTDTFSGNGSTTAFTMSVAPAGVSNVLIAISGVLQDPATYGVVGNTLNFSQAPPTGTNNISCRYLGVPATGVTTTAYRTQTEFTATAGQTTFSVPSYTPGFIDVYRNGVLLGSANFVATNGTTVVLNNAASSGDLIETISFFVSSVLNAIPATAGSVGTANIADNAITTAKIADSAITTAKIAAGAVVQADLATGVAGTGPAFSAFASSNTALANNTVLVGYQTKVFDTAGAFNNTGSTVTLNGISVPAFAFAPPVAGYYQVNASWATNSASAQYMFMSIYKNGSVGTGVIGSFTQTSGIGGITTVSGLLYLNGTSDYIQAYVFDSITCGTTTGQQYTYFHASMTRAA